MSVDSSLLYSCLLSKDRGGDEVVLWVSEIQGLQFTVILDRERQAKDIRLSLACSGIGWRGQC
jgi:hypothetical protein